jgi:hypothetical protein
LWQVAAPARSGILIRRSQVQVLSAHEKAQVTRHMWRRLRRRVSDLPRAGHANRARICQDSCHKPQISSGVSAPRGGLSLKLAKRCANGNRIVVEGSTAYVARLFELVSAEQFPEVVIRDGRSQEASASVD